jgi:predicted nucleotidyltransferase
MKPMTPYPELDAVLREHAERIKRALGDNFVGCYLQGSLAIGDFDLSSDVDFIVVTNRELTGNEVEKVQAAHLVTYDQDSRWVKRLEYSLFTKDKLRTLSSPYIEDALDGSSDRQLWYFNNGSRTIEKSDHCNTIVTRWTLRKKGVPILGPHLNRFIGTIATDDLRREIKNTLVGWGKQLLEGPENYKNRFYQSYLVLNYCRMLHDLYEGRVDSKLAGVKWAKVNLDPRWIELIDFCWKERQDSTISVAQPANPEVFPQSLEFVAYAVEKGRRYPIPSQGCC